MQDGTTSWGTSLKCHCPLLILSPLPCSASIAVQFRLFRLAYLTLGFVNLCDVNKVVLQIPYRSQFGSTSVPFTDSASFIANNCVATNTTNGADANANNTVSDGTVPAVRRLPGGRFAPKTNIPPEVLAKHSVSILIDDKPQSDIVLPPPLQPATPITGTGVAQFYLLADGKTGVLALGSFDEPDFDTFQNTLLTGLQTLVSKGATQLIADVVSNLYIYSLAVMMR